MTSKAKKASDKAYMQTPEGRASHKKSMDKYRARLKSEKITATAVVISESSRQALSNWI